LILEELKFNENLGYYYNMRMGSRSRYILIGVWCLMAVVLSNAYAGTLFSFLSVAKLEPIVNSLDELAQSKYLQLIVQDRSEMSIRFKVMVIDFKIFDN